MAELFTNTEIRSIGDACAAGHDPNGEYAQGIHGCLTYLMSMRDMAIPPGGNAPLIPAADVANILLRDANVPAVRVNDALREAGSELRVTAKGAPHTHTPSEEPAVNPDKPRGPRWGVVLASTALVATTAVALFSGLLGGGKTTAPATPDPTPPDPSPTHAKKNAVEIPATISVSADGGVAAPGTTQQKSTVDGFSAVITELMSQKPAPTTLTIGSDTNVAMHPAIVTNLLTALKSASALGTINNLDRIVVRGIPPGSQTEFEKAAADIKKIQSTMQVDSVVSSNLPPGQTAGQPSGPPHGGPTAAPPMAEANATIFLNEDSKIVVTRGGADDPLHVRGLPATEEGAMDALESALSIVPKGGILDIRADLLSGNGPHGNSPVNPEEAKPLLDLLEKVGGIFKVSGVTLRIDTVTAPTAAEKRDLQGEIAQIQGRVNVKLIDSNGTPCNLSNQTPTAFAKVTTPCR